MLATDSFLRLDCRYKTGSRRKTKIAWNVNQELDVLEGRENVYISNFQH